MATLSHELCTPPSADDVQSLAAMTVFNPPSRHAFLANAPALFGTLRMLGTHGDVHSGQPVKVFRHLREALAWLNLPDVAELDDLKR